MEIKRENATGKWELPKPLQINADNLKDFEAALLALVRRSQSPFANLSPSEHARARAARHVEELTAQLKVIERKLGKVFTARGVEHFDELSDAQKVIWRQLSESHAVTGRFDLAAHYAYDRAEAARLLRIWRAVWRDDAHFCSCPRTLAGLPQFFAVGDIWSVKHNREMILVKCAGCRCLNVTTRAEVLAPLKEQRAHRRAALATGAKTPAEEARLLGARNHTTKGLLK
jgi:hypothetical protein